MKDKDVKLDHLSESICSYFSSILFHFQSSILIYTFLEATYLILEPDSTSFT